VADGLTAVVTAPMTKGDASTALTARLPGRATWCPGCGVDHVPDQLFRDAGRQAQLAVGRNARRATTLAPAPEHPHRTVADPRLALLETFLRVNGPAATATYKDWLGGGTDVRGPWRRLGDVVRVDVDGKRLGLPAALLDDVTSAAPARGAVLVPAHDPYLRQTDRALLVPDAGRRREVWKAVSPPGALLVAGEVAGTWRLRDGTVTVTPFGRVPPAARKLAEAAAPAVAGTADPTVVWA
jgi:hypothetical protein